MNFKDMKSPLFAMIACQYLKDTCEVNGLKPSCMVAKKPDYGTCNRTVDSYIFDSYDRFESGRFDLNVNSPVFESTASRCWFFRVPEGSTSATKVMSLLTTVKEYDQTKQYVLSNDANKVISYFEYKVSKLALYKRARAVENVLRVAVAYQYINDSGCKNYELTAEAVEAAIELWNQQDYSGVE